MKYKVTKITNESEHEAADWIEDDEELIITDEEGNWWAASEFFHIHDIKEFTKVC